ncbi:hypothetical protein HA402_007534 [Bradysia odoriphaga]|nr:hypothetical protein HA402_007534 [Bradysia odoriphaga]
MQSFRYLLLPIVVLSAVCNINVGGISVDCSALSLLNIIRCITPLVNADGSILNCLTDCICIHGASGATCESGKCYCNNDANLDETALAQLRQTQCASVIQQGLQKSFMTVLCPDIPIPGTCNDDCRCGHGANSGRCNNEGYTLGDKTYKLCLCDYDD